MAGLAAVEPPTGALTLLFTDIEGSTRLLQRIGAAAYGRVLARHHQILRDAIAAHHGVTVNTEGDSFFAVFHRAPDGLTAAVQAQRSLSAEPWPGGIALAVRMGLHTGEVELAEGEYVGLDVHRAARIAAAAHGGQVVLSGTTQLIVETQLPDGVALRDLGEHRLKDLEQPERIYQLDIDGLPTEFPPLHALATRFELLPTEMSRFLGRDDVLQQAQTLLRTTRLLTLTGPGGTGKTRLAIELARLVADEFRDGAAFVPLAAISDPALVTTTVREALGFAEQPGRPALMTLIERLSERDVLLVLDNFEQVAAAASEVASLLAGVPGLTLVVTSRVALRLHAEQELNVPPLALPAPGAALEAVSRSEAVALFIQRARAVQPSFELTPHNAATIAEICRRLDGLPLAIELAAARVKHLPPSAILARLEKSLDLLQSSGVDRSDRQRTLRAAIEWSYDLLSPQTRCLYRRLAIFVGGWLVDDALSVVPAAGPLDLDVLDGTVELIDHSLVRRLGENDMRFAMLETIREFGRERLASAGELDATAAAHARRFADLAEEAEPHLTAGREWLDRLEADHSNIRTALAWLLANDPPVALLTAGRLWRFWQFRGHLREGATLLAEMLSSPAAADRTAARAKALIGLAGLTYWLTDYRRARSAYEEALAIARDVGARELEVETLYSLAYVRAIGRDWDGAIGDLRAAESLFSAAGNSLMAAWALETIGMVLTLQGAHEDALPLLDESLRRFEDHGDRFGVRNTLAVASRALMHLGRIPEARNMNRRVLEQAFAEDDVTSLSAALLDAAGLAAASGDHDRAARLYGAAQRAVEETGAQPPPELVNRIEPMPLMEGSLHPADLARIVAEGRAMHTAEAIELALG